MSELGLGTASAGEGAEGLDFGPLEPLVERLQDTDAEALLPALVPLLRSGTDLRTLTAAAALANARTFGGADYVGFHAAMALAPAWRMSLEAPPAEAPLPVLKVVLRSTARIREVGGRAKEAMGRVEPAALPEGRDAGDALREAVRAGDGTAAERVLAGLWRRDSKPALDALLTAVEDHTEVHRVVLAWRSYDLLDVVGEANAETLLRQSVRYCARQGGGPGGASDDPIRRVLPERMAEHGLLDRAPGSRPLADDEVAALARAFFEGTPEEAADRAAAALAADAAPSAVGEAVALGAVELLLRDTGRGAGEARPGKGPGSVHGDSIGVHACDSANAWRRLALAAGTRNRFACLIAGASQVAVDRVGRGGDFLHWPPHPLAEDAEAVAGVDPAALLPETDAAIREGRQGRACALVDRLGRLGHDPRPLLDLLRRHAVREDGALHAEKYWRTATEEFAATRPALRWRHLVALARVTASEFGRRAPGYDEARRLLDLPPDPVAPSR